MEELNLKQIEEVSGGFIPSIPRVAMTVLGFIAANEQGQLGRASYEDMMLAP